MSSFFHLEPVIPDDRIKQEMHPTLWKELREYFSYFLKIFFFIILFYIIIRSSIFDLIGVRGKSMYPNYNFSDSEDAIYIDQLTPKFSDYKRGEVIVMIAPAECDEKRSFYVKRIIGLPGEEVIVQNGKVYIINELYLDPGIELDESYYLPKESRTYYKNLPSEKFSSGKIPADSYFFLGDNRVVSADSRICGLIKKNQIIGREIFRLSPSSKRGWFQMPTYNISNI